MKPFDIDEYLKNPSRELVTRDGHKARIICTDKMGMYSVVALIFKDGDEIVKSYTELGHVIHGNAEPLDLFFASVKHKGWINIYKNDRGVLHGERVYDTEEEANKVNHGITSCVATISFEWEE